MKAAAMNVVMSQEQYLSVKTVASRLESSAATIWRWTAKGIFPQPVKLSAGCTRWRYSEIEKWVTIRQSSKAGK